MRAAARKGLRALPNQAQAKAISRHAPLGLAGKEALRESWNMHAKRKRRHSFALNCRLNFVPLSPRQSDEVAFYPHALQRLAKRQLRQEWVERAVNSPVRIEPDADDATLEHRLATVPELANRVLRVIVSKAEPKRVITAHLERKMKGQI